MASKHGGGGQPPPAVVLDANLLYPFHLRNLLVQLGVDLRIRPRWTGRIHDEWVGTLAAAGRVTRERLLRTRGIMERVLPDPDDRHVVAAALEAPAPTILTLNLRDVPAALLAPLGVVAEHPDAFLDALARQGLPAFVARLRAAAATSLISAWLSGGAEETTNRELSAVLGYPPSMEAIGTVPVGFPQKGAGSRCRRPLAQIVHWNGYRRAQMRLDAMVRFFAEELRPFAVYRTSEDLLEWEDAEP